MKQAPPNFPIAKTKNFFSLPVPCLFGLRDCTMELFLRQLVGAPCPPLDRLISRQMLPFISSYDKQISYSAVSHNFEILGSSTPEEEQEMQRLLGIGFGAVLRPWGNIADEYAAAWSQIAGDIYEKKQYLKQGLYADAESKATIGPYSDFGFSFPLPINDGITLLDAEREFRLPLDIDDYIEATGALTWIDYRGNDSAPSKFTHIRKNIYLERKPRKHESPPICDCRDEDECGDSCLNRCMFIECTDACPLGKKCTNKRFENLKDDNHRISVTKFPGRGFGLEAVDDFEAGELLVEYRGEIISSQTCMERMDTIYKSNRNHYFLNFGSSEVIDGHVKGTIARYINHSCEPNCHIEKWDVDGEYRVGVFSSRPIPAGEELTYDYNFESFGTKQACRCGSVRCKGFIGTSKLDPKQQPKPPQLKKSISAPSKKVSGLTSKSRSSSSNDYNQSDKSYYMGSKPVKKRKVEQERARELLKGKKYNVFLLRNIAQLSAPLNNQFRLQSMDHVLQYLDPSDSFIRSRNLFLPRTRKSNQKFKKEMSSIFVEECLDSMNGTENGLNGIQGDCSSDADAENQSVNMATDRSNIVMKKIGEQNNLDHGQGDFHRDAMMTR